MAYTIISQNNSTTTLSDGVNTITVPSRVNLTSGNFTIVEVNNNMATLEDGDGNVYRDIPCVATLAGEGGGGGSGLPDQTGHSGEFLTTDGTDASWASVDALQNTATGTYALTILGTPTTATNATNICEGSSVTGEGGLATGRNSTAGKWGAAYGLGASATGLGSVALGRTANVGAQGAIAIGNGAQALNLNGGVGSIAIGQSATANNTGAIQIGEGTISVANTFKVANHNGNYEIMSADGTIPTARLTNAINKYSSMPTAGADYLGQIAQFTGTTDATYTHGYIYECVSDGGNPATYSWTAVSVQAGGSSLPSQTGNAGKFLTTDGTDASWAAISALQNTATGTDSLTILGTPTATARNVNIGIGSLAGRSSVAIGHNAKVGDTSYSNSVSIGYNTLTGDSAIAIGGNARAQGTEAIAIGGSANTSYYTGVIQLGYGTSTASDTFQVWSYRLLNKSDGTIPAARHASLPAADGTYVLKLVIASGVPTLSWVAE